jgi:aspartate 1-decarboxylase
MRIVVLKSKLHSARVTGADLDYEGSIVIDQNLMEAVGIVEWERVLVVNSDNGNRYETYVIAGERGSGEVSVNGAGARYSCVGDRLTIFGFAHVEVGETVSPQIAVLDDRNRIRESYRGGEARDMSSHRHEGAGPWPYQPLGTAEIS